MPGSVSVFLLIIVLIGFDLTGFVLLIHGVILNARYHSVEMDLPAGKDNTYLIILLKHLKLIENNDNTSFF